MRKMMSTLILLPFIIIMLILSDSTMFCVSAYDNFTNVDCIPRERRALLRFKATVSDPADKLVSWDTTTYNCCTWEGVECDKSIGHVIGIDLRNRVLDYDRYPSFGSMLQSRTLDSSLLEFKHLTYLDLSGNDFNHTSIPAFLGLMKQLLYLNLSYTSFTGIVPHQLGNLSSLRTLDLGYQNLRVDDLMWASNLSSLEHLDFTHVNLTTTKDHLVKVLNTLPSLQVLRLSGSGLDNTYLPHTHCVNSTLFTNIQHLDLSFNLFQGDFPCFLHNMTSLRFLDLSDNHYNSSDSHFLISTNLEHLDFARNALNNSAYWITDLLNDKCCLKSLVLWENFFYGDISVLLKNLSGCWSHTMEIIDLSYNEFYGQLPEELGELKHLKRLGLSVNKLSGPIPHSIENLTSLGRLGLYDNQLSGEIPIFLGQLSHLEWIDISHNAFEGTLSEPHFAKLSKLDGFLAGSNMLEFRVGDDWVPPFQLGFLDMSSLYIGGQVFPQWLRTQTKLEYLFLSNSSIRGTLPSWLHSFMNLTYLYLSHNHIEGSIPELPPNIRYLLLSNNKMSGPIPDSLCEMKSLQILDLSKNLLSGHLPECWDIFLSLHVVVLSSNQLSGPIPNSTGGRADCSLTWLGLSNNSFTGKLPQSLKNCRELIVLDAGENQLSGKLPEWIGNDLLHLIILRLRSNELYGDIPTSYCQMSLLRIMGLANNKLTGNIPHCFTKFSGMVHNGNSESSRYALYDSISEVLKGVMLEYKFNVWYLVNLDLSSNQLVGEIPAELMNLTGLKGLNLSHNHLRGNIPVKIGDIVSLESLDLSNNNLNGTIPESLSKLTFLSHLNLSNNNLSGRIPTGPQLRTLDGSSDYNGNPGLCGAALANQCEINTTLPKAENGQEHHEDSDMTDKLFLYAFVISGFATGFWGYFGVLVFKRSWRLALFGWMDVVLCKMMGRC